MATAREQKLVDLIFSFSIACAHGAMAGKSTEEVAKWISAQLEILGFPTYPMGQSWGVLEEKHHDGGADSVLSTATRDFLKKLATPEGWHTAVEALKPL